MGSSDHNNRIETPSEQATCTSRDLFTASLQLRQSSLCDQSEPENYTISAAEIEQLLNTSFRIDIRDDETTPVRIWHFLKHLIVTEDQQQELLEKITEDLLKHVECSQ